MTNRSFPTARRLAGAFATLTLAFGLAACGSNDSDFDYSASFSQKIDAEVSELADEAAASESSDFYDSDAPEPTRSRESEPSRSCGVDEEADEIYEHISEVPAAGLFDGNVWKYGGDSNYDPCADLSYASLYQDGTHASTPSQLMLFHQGEYLGVGSDQLLNPIDFLEVTDSSITIRYKDWKAWEEAGASYAESPNYYTDITYSWDGEKVQMSGYIPQ